MPIFQEMDKEYIQICKELPQWYNYITLTDM